MLRVVKSALPCLCFRKTMFSTYWLSFIFYPHTAENLPSYKQQVTVSEGQRCCHWVLHISSIESKNQTVCFSLNIGFLINIIYNIYTILCNRCLFLCCLHTVLLNLYYCAQVIILDILVLEKTHIEFLKQRQLRDGKSSRTDHPTQLLPLPIEE